ncbi:MAG: hypothetical protein FWE02_05260 [Defluviitaleaceae bacterium]|nr:hypothetical protein [Defluviitaleaceae bacterium]
MEASNNAPGKSLLKAVGIIYIILSALSLLGSLFSFDIISIITSGWGVFVGIFAVLNCENLEKAKTIKLFAMIDIVVTIIGVIIAAIVAISTLGALLGVAGAIGAIIGSLLIGAIGLVLPILLLVGANRNLKAQ